MEGVSLVGGGEGDMLFLRGTDDARTADGAGR